MEPQTKVLAIAGLVALGFIGAIAGVYRYYDSIGQVPFQDRHIVTAEGIKTITVVPDEYDPHATTYITEDGPVKVDVLNDRAFYMPELVAQQNYDTKLIASLIHEKVNHLREVKGVAPLDFDPVLAEIAEAHSMDMSARNYYAHDNLEYEGPTERAAKVGYSCPDRPLKDGRAITGIGENIDYGHAYTVRRDADNIGILFDTSSSFGWMNNTTLANTIYQTWYDSHAHRTNMYNANYHAEGIGVYIDDYARVFATQDFC